MLLAGNAVVGFREEYQAGNAIAALKARLALQARVKRDGAWIGMEARELVPGKAPATIAAVYGFLMTPIAWKWALLIWSYALVWFLMKDRLKLEVYKLFDPEQPRLHHWRTAVA